MKEVMRMNSNIKLMAHQVEALDQTKQFNKVAYYYD